MKKIIWWYLMLVPVQFIGCQRGNQQQHGRCKTAPTMPKKVENVIRRCQEEVKYQLIEETLRLYSEHKLDIPKEAEKEEVKTDHHAEHYHVHDSQGDHQPENIEFVPKNIQQLQDQLLQIQQSQNNLFHLYKSQANAAQGFHSNEYYQYSQEEEQESSSEETTQPPTQDEAKKVAQELLQYQPPHHDYPIHVPVQVGVHDDYHIPNPHATLPLKIFNLEPPDEFPPYNHDSSASSSKHNHESTRPSNLQRYKKLLRFNVKQRRGRNRRMKRSFYHSEEEDDESLYHLSLLSQEDKWVAGCLMQCIFRKNEVVDNHGWPTLDGLVDLFTDGVHEQKYFMNALRSVDTCLKGASKKHKVHRDVKPDEKASFCYVAFDVFDCVSDKILEYCNGTD